MQIFRFMLIPFLSLSFATFHPQNSWFQFIRAQNQSVFEKTKWLFVPLLLQTCIELPTHHYPAYLPARLCMIIVSLFLMGALLSFVQHLCHLQNQTLDILIYFISLIQGFIFEAYYLRTTFYFHPYDPFFAGLGLFFLFLIYLFKSLLNKKEC